MINKRDFQHMTNGVKCQPCLQLLPTTLTPKKKPNGDGEDVEKTASPTGSPEEGSGGDESPESTTEDSNLVDWDGPDDPHNPLNWSQTSKVITIVLASAVTFVVSLAPTVFAPGVPQITKEFNSTSSALASLCVSIYIIGLIIGPLVVAPLSELYGRTPIWHISNVLFFLCSLAIALSKNLAMFIVFRLLTGIFSATPVSLGGGFIADIMPVEKRGKAMIAWLLGPLLGPVIGPVAGGFLAQEAGWRWIAWLVTICSGTLTLTSFIFFRETYASAILSHKVARLRKQTGNNSLRSKYDKGEKASQLFRVAIVRPAKMLVRSPIVAILAVYTSIVYSYMYLLFTTFIKVFEGQYGFNTGEAGLAYLGLGIGFFLGQVGVGFFDQYTIKKKKESGRPVKPEDRLTPLIFGGLSVPIGLIIYGIGILFVFFPIQIYLVDAFTVFAASALATNTVVRSVFGATIPLAGPKMYSSLGLGWGNTLLAFIALAFMPSPFLLIRYGEMIRTHPKFQVKL
ncbi:hypothetical protein G7Y89_g9963 [Cudoniella acicularis]|uniref:Major facilitator superfamily (MFS) profile domain-containing protein n=1 Tax=Cudoniella acicularis TaxID=354080 RepID=A0A8H4RDN1_9HELO|nr:hypothetical protein G7Y89_g9963 [Cudoniella acicularis]